jgi:hypothetical protein
MRPVGSMGDASPARRRPRGQGSKEAFVKVDGDWVTVEAAAQAVRVDVETLREWCRDGLVASFRDGPYKRFVRLEDARQHGYLMKGGRPRTSLHALIASATGAGAGHSSEARVTELQNLVRERAMA